MMEARRLHRLGLGIDVGRNPAPGTVVAAVRRILADGGYRSRVERARAAMAADADPAALIESMAAPAARADASKRGG